MHRVIYLARAMLRLERDVALFAFPFYFDVKPALAVFVRTCFQRPYSQPVLHLFPVQYSRQFAFARAPCTFVIRIIISQYYRTPSLALGFRFPVPKHIAHLAVLHFASRICFLFMMTFAQFECM